MEFAQKDSAGNLYVEINELRITYVPADARKKAKNWPGQDILRIQTYQDKNWIYIFACDRKRAKNDKNRTLYKTLESPINDSDLLELIGEIALLSKAVKKEVK
jgi:ribosomal 50S subunit-recycling heat shock protein